MYITLPGSGLSATSSQNIKHIVYYTTWVRVIRCQFSKHKTHCILHYLGPGYPRPVLKTQNTLYITLPGSGLSAASSQNIKHIVYYTTWVRVIRCQFSKHKTHCILHYLGPGYPLPVLKTHNTLYITLPGSGLFAASSQNTNTLYITLPGSGLSAACSQNIKHIVYNTTWVRVIRCLFSKHKTHCILLYLCPGYPLPVLKTKNTLYITLPVSGLSAASSLNTKHIVYYSTCVRVIRDQFSKHKTHCILLYLCPGYPLPVL